MLSGSRMRTPSPQRGEGWGEGAPTERPYPPHPALSPLGRGRRGASSPFEVMPHGYDDASGRDGTVDME